MGPRKARPTPAAETPEPAPGDLGFELREALGVRTSRPRHEKGRISLGKLPPVDLLPTGHLVCEACGRIARSALPTLLQEDLAEIATGSPEGWQVRTVSVSFAGVCPSCQNAPARAGPRD